MKDLETVFLVFWLIGVGVTVNTLVKTVRTKEDPIDSLTMALVMLCITVGYFIVKVKIINGG